MKDIKFTPQAIEEANKRYAGQRVQIINQSKQFGRMGTIESISLTKYWPDKYWVNIKLDGDEELYSSLPGGVKLLDQVLNVN